MKKNYIICVLIIMAALAFVVTLSFDFGNTKNNNVIQEPTINDIVANAVDTTVEGNNSIESIVEDETEVDETETFENEPTTEVTTEETIDSDINVEPTETKATTETKETVEIEKPTDENQTAIINADHYSCSLSEIYYTLPVREYTEEQKELIVRMLYCESGSTSWDCQVATCSAILNLIERKNGDFSILDRTNVFSPAPYYRNVTPMQTQYDVLSYVLSGHLIANVKYFRTNHYHSFGTPMFAIDNVYFSR